MTIGPRPRRENDPRRQVGRHMFSAMTPSEYYAQVEAAGRPMYDQMGGGNTPRYEAEDDQESPLIAPEARWDEEEQDPNWGKKYPR